MTHVPSARPGRTLLAIVATVLFGAACGGAHVPSPESRRAIVTVADGGAAQRPVDGGERERAELAARDIAATERIATAREQQAALVEASRDQVAQQTAEATHMQAAAAAAARARMSEVVAQIEMRIHDVDEALSVLAGLRNGTVDARVTLSSSTSPPICGDRGALESTRMLSESGTQVSWDATGLVQLIDDLCGRFQRWHVPDERSRPAIASYVQKITRIEGWMRDIRGCLGTSGRDAARCENAYGRTQDAEAAEARSVETLLAAHHRELDGVDTGARPFPCTTPILARIEGMTFTGSVARAQLPGMPRDAERVCATIGVGERELRDALRDLRIRLDQAESTLRAQRRSRANELELLHAQLGE